MNETIERIPLNQLTPCPTNRRVGGFDPGKLQQLAESIKSLGVQVPAVVRRMPEDTYEIVAGERRWRASKLAEVDTLPCVVRKLTDAEVIKIRAVENVQREDVHPLDEAESYQQLIDSCGYEVETVACELGKSASYVYQRLKLKDLVPKVREMFIEGKITAGHAILIARLGPTQQEEVLEDGLVGWNDEVATVRELGEWIQQSILMDLSKTTWKANDAELVPTAGSCSACPKRTGYLPELFADVGKKDHCTDRTCFAEKGAAMVERRRAELKEEPHLEVRSGYSREKVPGALEAHEWNECKKKDVGAVRVLIVDGPNRGRMTYGKASGKAGEAKAAAADPKAASKLKAERAKEKKIENARKNLLEEIYDAIRGKAQDLFKERKEAEELLQFRRLMAFTAWQALGGDTQNWLAKFAAWEQKPEPTKRSNSISWTSFAQGYVFLMSPKELDLFIVFCTYAPSVRILNNQYFSIPQKLREAAKFLGFDIQDLVEAKLKAEGIKRKDLLPAIPKYLQDGPEDEDE